MALYPGSAARSLGSQEVRQSINAAHARAGPPGGLSFVVP
jgi:hypothetical protein